MGNEDSPSSIQALAVKSMVQTFEIHIMSAQRLYGLKKIGDCIIPCNLILAADCMGLYYTHELIIIYYLILVSNNN